MAGRAIDARSQPRERGTRQDLDRDVAGERVIPNGVHVALSIPYGPNASAR
jgi:hypothetical protein